MTYNSGHSNKSSSRHSNYSNNHSHGPNNLQSGSNHQITANAMAALMNQSMAAAAMMHPFAMSGLPTQPGNHRNHQQGTNQQQTISPLNYFGFTFPNASDPIRSYYHAQPLSGHAVSTIFLYTKIILDSFVICYFQSIVLLFYHLFFIINFLFC